MVITLPDSGREVEIARPKIAQSALYMQLLKKYPRPSIPMQEVKIMGRLEWVENLAHPSYEKEVREWQRIIQTKMAEKTIMLAVKSTPDSDDDLVAIDQMRGIMGEIAPDMTDQEIFIFFVLIQSQEDFEAISSAVGELNNPTEAQIANHAERFQRKATGS